jgi:hypothetical protein
MHDPVDDSKDRVRCPESRTPLRARIQRAVHVEARTCHPHDGQDGGPGRRFGLDPLTGTTC